MARRIALHGFALLVVFGCVAKAYAQEDDLQSAADEAGVSVVDLAGALSTTGLDAATYLCRIGEGPCPKPVGYPARVRLTHYVESGTTYGGGHTYPGSTACSWNWPLGTRFQFPDGEVFTCNDRGLLGSSGWLDLFRRPDLAAAYGPYATVTVLP
jgi:hypothetical protein